MKFKVGDKVEITTFGGADKGTIMDITYHPGYRDNAYLIKGDNIFGWRSIDDIKKIEDEKMDKLKLVVGEKFHIKGEKNNPYTFLGYLRDYGHIDDEFQIMCLNRYGVYYMLKEEVYLPLIKKEPIKNEGEFWVRFAAGGDPCYEDILDRLTGLNTFGNAYFSKKEAIMGRESDEKIAKFKFTVEEVEDND